MKVLTRESDSDMMTRSHHERGIMPVFKDAVKVLVFCNVCDKFIANEVTHECTMSVWYRRFRWSLRREFEVQRGLISDHSGGS